MRRMSFCVALLGAALFLAAPAGADISGTVFRDVDGDGVNDGGVEAGVGGIDVQAFAAGNAPVATDTTAADGTYNLTLGAGDYRVEFIIPAALDHFEPGANLSGSGNTSVVFATNGATGVDFGVINPGQYCQADPIVAINCYLKGPQTVFTNPGDDVLVSFPYDAGCADEDQDGACDAGSADLPVPTEVALGAEIGTTWGMAYHRESDSLFASAFQKRHSGFRASGDTGLIFRINDASLGVPATVVDYVDFDALGIPTADTAAFPATDGDPHPAPADTCTSALADGDPGSTNNNCWLHDSDSYAEVGRIAFGDLDISDDGSTLWTINLFDNTLYSIPVQSAPVVFADIDDFALPSPTCAGSIQPFGIGIEDGLVYTGMVCDGPTTADLRAFVYSFDPDTSTFTQVLDEPLNYGRGLVVDSGGANIPAEWQPWSDDFADVLGPVFGTERGLPQPMLADIEFDQGDMILGIRDRFADMSGFDDGTPDNTSATTVRGDSAGDIIRACPSGSTWVFESNASCGGNGPTSGAGNGEGPGGGEYYFEERLTTIHDEVNLAGLFQVPINDDVVSSVYDPLNSAAGVDVFSGGAHWYRRSDGEVDNLYRLFLRTDPDTFGKAGGLGDVEAFCDAAPFEIGNRVWVDTDNDGVQDPGESGFSGVTVLLFEDPDGVCDGGDETQVGSVVTPASGEYIFTDANVTGGLQTDTNYCIRIVIPAGFGPSPLDAAPVGDGDDDIRDSDGDSTPFPGSVVTTFTTGGPGANRHIYDFGFRALEFDWGDLPDGPYPTLAASSGPNHEITSVGNCFLGGAPDMELDGQPNADATGDDTDLDGDDEDGVTFLTPLNPGDVADISVVSSGACVLNAWIDFNSDGDFADPGEQIASDLALVAGANLLDDIPVPVDADLTMAARFRVTNLVGQGGDSPTGAAVTGEVEDYVLACIGDFVWNDSIVGQGIQVGGDTPVPGVDIELLASDGVTPILDGAGTPITTTTDVNGNYKFPGLPEGDYRLLFDLPAPFVDFSPRDNTTDDLDSDADQISLPTVGLTQVVSVSPGDNDSTVDAGLRAVTIALITSATAYADGGGVVFEFSTGYEALSSGFEVFRLEDETNAYVPVSRGLIPALLGSPQGGVYRVADERAPFSEKLRYVIVEHQGDGRNQVYGPYSVDVTDRGDRAPMTESAAALPHVSRGFAERMERARRASSPIADTQRVARGPQTSWTLQVDVRDTGLYRVSAAEIAAALNQPESRARYLISNALITMENQGQTVAWRPADRSGSGLFFYGEALDSLYDLDNTYWLRLNERGPTMGRVMQPLAAPALGGVFTSTERFEEDITPAINGVRETEVDHWFWGGINAENTNNVLTFDVTVPDATAGAAVITARFAGATDGFAANDHHAIVRINGVEVGTAAWGGIELFETSFAFDSSILTPLTTIEVEGILAEGSDASIFFIDGFDVEYQRFYRAVDDRLLVTGDGNAVVTVEGFSSADVAAFDLTDPNSPARVRNLRVLMGADGFHASFVPATPDTPYFVTTETAAVAAANLRVVAPAIDLEATHHRYEHVVIAPEAWRWAAEDLANHHSRAGLSSLAVSIEDVYDAFSHGIATPWAIRDFLAYARDNWSEGPTLAVLAGRGTLDPRDLLGGGDNFIPVVLVGTPQGLVATDNVLADLTGADSIPEVAIGRLPIVSADELADYLAKLDGYSNSKGAWRGRAMLLADDTDYAGNFPVQSDDVAALLPSYTQEYIYLSDLSVDDARANLQASWNAGAQLVNYIGHGGVTQAAAEGLLRVSDMGALANGDRLPIVSALTCIVGRSDIPNLESLAEALVTDLDGGAIAVWAPTGISFGGAAHRLNLHYAEALEAAAPGASLGSIVLEALAAFGAEGGRPRTLNAYAIAGDPAVALP